jgi:hypothetical protein
MAPISGGKLQQIDLQNRQQDNKDNIPVMGSKKNGNSLEPLAKIFFIRSLFQKSFFQG